MTNKQTEAAIGLLLSSSRHMGAGDRALLELFRSTGRLPVPPVSEGAPPKRTYIASSKRNPFYPGVVIRARETGYEVHDWSDPPLAIDPDCQNWTCSQYIAAFSPAREHFENYKRAIEACDACVLLLPAGTDAHAEAVMAQMLGKPTIVCFADGRPQRELIHCQFDLFATSVDELMSMLATALVTSIEAA